MLLGTEISLEVIVVNAEYQSDYDNLNSTLAKAFMDSFELEVWFLVMVLLFYNFVYLVVFRPRATF